MSRGLGRMQRTILASIEEKSAGHDAPPWISVDEAVTVPQPQHLTRSQLESGRRAFITLERRGHLELAYVWRDVESASGWSGKVGRRKLCARLTLNEEQREAERLGRIEAVKQRLAGLAAVGGDHGTGLFNEYLEELKELEAAS